MDTYKARVIEVIAESMLERTRMAKKFADDDELDISSMIYAQISNMQDLMGSLGITHEVYKEMNK